LKIVETQYPELRATKPIVWLLSKSGRPDEQIASFLHNKTYLEACELAAQLPNGTSFLLSALFKQDKEQALGLWREKTQEIEMALVCEHIPGDMELSEISSLLRDGIIAQQTQLSRSVVDQALTRASRN
jgi:hypothetical protein